MALRVYNITGAPVVLAAGNPVRTIPLSAAPPARGPAVDVTSELRPNLAVDPANGVAGGLDAAAFILLQAQAASLVFEWTSDPEYTTGTLVTAGPAPGAHAPTHKTAGGTDVLAVGSSNLSKQDVLPALSTPGTNYVAQYAGGAAIADAVGPFVIPGYPYRTAQITLGVGGVPTVYTIDGTDRFDNVVQDVITAGAAGTFQGAIAWKTITNFASDVDPVGTTDLEVGNGFCLSDVVDTGITLLVVDEVPEAAASEDVSSATVVPTTAPDGTKNFVAQFPVAHTHTVV
jgi:hypothetical protein